MAKTIAPRFVMYTRPGKVSQLPIQATNFTFTDAMLVKVDYNPDQGNPKRTFSGVLVPDGPDSSNPVTGTIFILHRRGGGFGGSETGQLTVTITNADGSTVSDPLPLSVACNNAS
jgi:hypothetical protein